jgi:hypothetical protein
MPSYTRASIAHLAQVMESKSSDPTRHKCFVSYHSTDADEAAAFLESFGTEFIPRTLGVTEDDPFINSQDEDYIKEQISTKYMADSTVTILLVGKCTWARMFIDWEIGATLRNSPVNKRSGLLAYKLPSAADSQKIPDRLSDNYTYNKPSESYASYLVYPSSKSSVRSNIQTAFEARDSKAYLIDNSRALFRSNRTCP